jgi:hypothetical protein
MAEIVDTDGRQMGQVESIPAALAAAKVMATQYNKVLDVKVAHTKRTLFRVTPIVRVKVENYLDNGLDEAIMPRYDKVEPIPDLGKPAKGGRY